jgi:hypothetical protein
VVRLARAVRAEVTELANSVQYQQTPAYLDELVGPPVVLVPGVGRGFRPAAAISSPHAACASACFTSATASTCTSDG